MTSAGSGVSTARIERRSWLLAGALAAGSLFWRSPPVLGGVALGAFLAIVNYRWLRRFASALTASPRRPSRLSILFYLLKYLLTGLAIFFSIKYDFANAVALLVGVSVIFLAICWEGVNAHRNEREDTSHAAEF